jgi:hypothetical protein
MGHNTDALGFIPKPTVQHRYIAHHRYVLQTDEHGHPVGYLLHGAIRRGAAVVISQHCIEVDARRKHYGIVAFQQFLSRCQRAGASSIHLRVADDLPAVEFWRSCGFQTKAIVPGGERRGRMIVEMSLPLDLPLFSVAIQELA